MRVRPIIVAAAVIASSFVGPHAASAEAFCAPLDELFPDGVTTLQGDVDGDRRIDTVSTSASWTGERTCRAWLTVETARGSVRRRIDPLFGSLVAPPALAGLIRLGPGPQLDIAVVVMLGASTGFVDVYGMRGHELTRVSEETYAYAGSVVNRAGVDCLRDRGSRIVVSMAAYGADDRYHVERTFFALRGGTLRRLAGRTEHAVVGFNALNRYPEFASFAPFPSCTSVTAPT